MECAAAHSIVKTHFKKKWVQTVEKVQFLLGFFCVLWYNKVGDKNDSKRQNA